MKKPEAVRNRALDLFLKSKGNIKLKEIADKVKATPLTVGRWKKADDWESKLKEQAAAPSPPTKPQARVPKPVKPQKTEPPVKRGGSRALRKQALFDQALKLFIDSKGSFTNTALAKNTGVSLATIAKWKQMPEWQVPVKEEPSKAEPVRKEEPAIDLTNLTVPGQVLDDEGVLQVLSRVNESLDAQINQCVQAKANVLLVMELIRRRKD